MSGLPVAHTRDELLQIRFLTPPPPSFLLALVAVFLCYGKIGMILYHACRDQQRIMPKGYNIPHADRFLVTLTRAQALSPSPSVLTYQQPMIVLMALHRGCGVRVFFLAMI